MAVIIIPAAGEGSRFAKAGYTDSKPMLIARGAPMIARVLWMFASTHRKIVVCRAVDVDRIIGIGGGNIAAAIPLDKLTEGAALTVLCAEAQVSDDEPVVVVNSDNLILGGAAEGFIDEALKSNCDGAMLLFRTAAGPWSFAKLRGNRVVQVAEKSPISDFATAGVYYFKCWRILRTAICRMVANNDRVNGEFYLAPVYNYMIGVGMSVLGVEIPRHKFVSLGTPEDLEHFNALT